MIEIPKGAPPVEDERPFRRLQLGEVDNDIKQSTVPIVDFYGHELYPMIIQLQMLRQLNKLVALIGELIEKGNNSSNSIDDSGNSDNSG